MFIRRRFLLLGALFALHMPAVAQADVKVQLRAAGLPGSGSYGPDILKPEELEQCVKSARDINANSDALETAEAAVKMQTSEIGRLNQEIERNSRQLDRTNQSIVDSHNANVQRYQTLIKDHNAQISTFNSRTYNHNVQIQKFTANCADKKYYESDRQAVRSRTGS